MVTCNVGGIVQEDETYRARGRGVGGQEEGRNLSKNSHAWFLQQ